MKLQKALKLRKKLIGEIAELKGRIYAKNSYLIGSLDPNKYNVPTMYETLEKKIAELITLKYVINEANRDIQSLIYQIGENKGMIQFLKNLAVTEGKQISGYGNNAQELLYAAQFDDEKKQKMIIAIQEKVDAMQELIDTHNHTMDIPYGEDDVFSTVNASGEKGK